MSSHCRVGLGGMNAVSIGRVLCVLRGVLDMAMFFLMALKLTAIDRIDFVSFLFVYFSMWKLYVWMNLIGRVK